ncbi:hypothetical protein BKA69DRAFT_1081019 [Paraphysoderma sedebokerense]|nr:hypothetical protein BKA69DRAFT_1081019 [Paraphysoderma sedebokerense]
MIQNSVEHFYDWPLVRTQDLPNYVETYCYLQPMYKNELLELARSSFPPNFQKDSATEWVNHVAKLIQTAKTNQYESTVAGCLQPISVDRILNYVSIFDGQIKIESTVFLPVLNSLVPHTTFWESSIVLSMQKMKKDLIPCITKDAFTVNDSFVTLIKNIDEILDKVKEMKREITKKDDISYADIDLNLSTVAEPILRSWSREVDKTMAEYTKRAFNLDSFEPMDERNKYSQSVVELFTLCHANLKALLSFPLSSAIEIYVVPVVESLVTSVVRYVDLCGNVPTLKTDIFGTHDDPEPMKLKSGRAGSLASISGSGTINDPAENTKIYVKINNLHFAKGQLRELVSTLKKRCEELNICCVKDGFNWNHLFDRGFRQIRQKTNILLQYIASKLLYNDFRSIFAESLYSHASTGCSLRDILPKIDKRSEFRQCVHQDFFDDLLLYWMQCVLEGVEKAIFEIGSKRVFRPEDATALEEDMRELAKIFVSKGSDKPGLPGDVVSASLKPLKSLISTVMPLATEVLVEAYEQTFQSTDPSIASLSNPFCPYHLKRVICHRNDNAAKAFVKKYKIKGVKVKEEKS